MDGCTLRDEVKGRENRAYAAIRRDLHRLDFQARVDLEDGCQLDLSRQMLGGNGWLCLPHFLFHLSPVMDQPNIASIFYGPVLLAVEEREPLSTWRTVTMDADDIGKSITGDPSRLRFKTNGVNLRPFFEMYGRHSVYMDVTLK